MIANSFVPEEAITMRQVNNFFTLSNFIGSISFYLNCHLDKLKQLSFTLLSPAVPINLVVYFMLWKAGSCYRYVSVEYLRAVTMTTL